MKLDDWYEQQYPEHSRDSCSDAQPVNADVDGSGCHRCNAILFTQHGEFKKDAEHWRQECKVAREMYYEAINQRDELLAALEKIKMHSVSLADAQVVALEAIASVKEK